MFLRYLLFVNLLTVAFSTRAQITSTIQSVPNLTTVIKPGAPGGYYFLAPFNPSQGTQMVLDSTGALVYYRIFPIRVTDFKQQPNGQITYYVGNKFYIMDQHFMVVDSVSVVNGILGDEHELRILPNGHYLLLGQENEVKDLSNFQYFINGTADGSKMAVVSSMVIQELDQAHQLVFEWHGKDHMTFNTVDDFWLYDSSVVDWSHSNALDVDLDGNFLLSTRHFNEITKIDRNTGNIIWHFGGKNNQFQFIGNSTPFYGQHYIRRLANGRLSLFDNGLHTTSHAARAVEYELDETNFTAKLVFSHSFDTTHYSLAMGNVEHIGNGQRIINYGVLLGTDIAFNVIDSLGQSLFEIHQPTGNYNYRAFHYPADRATFTRPVISCFDSLGVTYLTPGRGFNKYSWNNGSTDYAVRAASGTFQVVVQNAQGGNIYSLPLVASQGFACMETGVREIVKESISIYPNPASDVLHVESNTNLGGLTVMDVSGRVLPVPVTLDRLHAEVTISALEPGIYFLSNGQKFVKMR